MNNTMEELVASMEGKIVIMEMAVDNLLTIMKDYEAGLKYVDTLEVEQLDELALALGKSEIISRAEKKFDELRKIMG